MMDIGSYLMSVITYLKSIIFLLILVPVSLLSSWCTTTKVVKNTTLVGKTILIPDYALVGLNVENVSLPEIETIASHFEGFIVADHPFYNITKVITKDEKFVVVVQQVYTVTSGLGGSYSYAVVKDEAGHLYRIAVFEDEDVGMSPMLSGPLVSKCSGRCATWRYLFEYMTKNRLERIEVRVGILRLRDARRPPYPKGMLSGFQGKLIQFCKKNNIKITEIESHHPYISMSVSLLDLGKLLADRDWLEINTIGILTRLGE